MNSKLSSISNLSSSLLTNVSTILNSVKNSAGTAIQALQTMESRNQSAGLSTADWLNRLSSQVGVDGALVGRLTSDGLGAASWLNRLSSQLNAGGALANRLDSVVTLLGSTGTLAGYLTSGDLSVASWINRISSQLNSGGALANRLDSAVSLLSTLGTISSQLGVDGALSGRLDVLANRLSYTPSGSSTLQTAGGMLWQLLQAVRGLDIGGVIDGIETGSTSIVQRLAQLPGILQDGFSSVVEGLGNVAITFPDSITATLSGDATISAETDVAGEAAQTASLYDSLVGEVDADGLRSQLDGLVGVLRTSFPFGCIFVLIDACDALSAAPVAPVFSADLPAVVGTYHAEIDLSFFDSVATLWRGGMLVIYVAGLYSATKQWVFNGGGESA